MAKKKNETEEKIEVKEVSQFSKNVKDKYKKEYGIIIKNGAELITKRTNQKIISVGPIIDITLKGGLREGTWTIMSGAPKCGKAQPHDVKVMTPDGYKLMGSINVGDKVCGAYGEVSTVKGVYPQGLKQVYLVHFSDGTVTQCCEEHLWTVRKNLRDEECVTIPLKDFKDDLHLSDRYKWQVPVPYALDTNRVDTIIEPYDYGILMSWCHLRNKRLEFSNVPQHIFDALKEFAKKHGLTCSSSAISNISDDLIDELKRLSINATFTGRVVHDPYRFNSINNKLDFLRGLFTRMAYQHRDGGVEYTCKSSYMGFLVIDIVRSLGFYATYSFTNDCECRIRISTDNPSELLKNVPYEPMKNRKMWKNITSVEVGEHKLCSCIELDSPDGLYVTDGYNVTHNTTTAMQIVATGQQEGRKVLYVNTEGRLDVKNFDIAGVSPENIEIITADDVPIPAEVFLEAVVDYIKDPANRGAICVIDSVSSLAARRELEDEVKGDARPPLPKILSNFFKKAGQIVPNNDIIMILITHMITNISGYGGKMADSGVKIQYQGDTKFVAEKVEVWQNAQNETIGQAVNWHIPYSCLGGNGKCQSWIRYGHGIDRIQELIIIGEELGLIDKSGAWYRLDFMGDEPAKFHGIDKTYAYLEENAEALELLNQKVKEITS